jgi:hypothetical protein
VWVWKLRWRLGRSSELSVDHGHERSTILTGRRQWRTVAMCGRTQEEGRWGFIGMNTRGRAVRRPPKATGVTAWARDGGRRAHSRRPMEEGGAGAGGCASAACHRPMARPCVTPRRHTVPTEPSLRPVVASVHHRRAHLGVRRRGRRGALGTTSRGVLVLAPNHFKVALVDWMFLKNLQLNYTEA